MIAVPPRVYVYAALALAVAVGGQRYGSARYDAGQAEVNTRWTAERLQQQAQAVQASIDNARETQRRLDRQKENDDAQAQQLARAAADAAAARTAADRLRDQVDTTRTAARRAGGNPAAVAVGTPAGDALDLFADLFGRADAVAGDLGAALDRSYAAGVRCERDYDALNMSVKLPDER